MPNPINIAKSSAQFIFTNSTSAVTYIASRVNKIFKSTINVLVDAVRSTTTCIYTKASSAIQSFSNYFFETPKADIIAIYKKGQDGTREELRILPNFKKIKFLNKRESILALQKINPSSLSLADAKNLWTYWSLDKKNN